MGNIGAGNKVGERAYFPLLDSLRGLAALGVFVLHIGFYLGAGTGLSVVDYLVQHVSNYPAPSVVIFFALSGFVLYRPFAAQRYDQRPRGSLGEYAIRRAVRILPAYWAALVITALVLQHGYVFSGAGLFRYFGFGQVYDIRTFNQGVPTAWSLDVDVAFYAALPLVVLAMRQLPARSRRQFLASELAMCAVLYAVSTVWQALAVQRYAGHSAFFPAELSLPGSLDIFACGMALAVLSVAFAGSPEGDLRRLIARRPWLPWLAAVAAYVMIGELPQIIGHGHLTVVWLAVKQLRCVLAVAVLLPLIFGLSGGGLLRAALASRPARYLGTISYAFYLWHWVVIQELAKTSLRGSVGAPIFIVIALAMSVALASASWFALEQPLQRIARRRLARRHVQPGPAPAVLEPVDVATAVIGTER